MKRLLSRRALLPALVLAVVLAIAGAGIAVAAGLVPLAKDCSGSKLPPHDGFQKSPACASTAFGEVSDETKNPSLLITKAPEEVKSGQDFELRISSRNLVRDRFLAAGQGGFYLESALLNTEGFTRGHLHVACRALQSDRRAPAPEAVPGFFKAIEDGKGGARADTVKVTVTGAKNGQAVFRRGATVQCAVWAGDGSHRTPMMERANQTPAFDVVRVSVR